MRACCTWTSLLLLLLAVGLLPAARAVDDEPRDLAALPDSRLLDEYEGAGLAIQNTYALPSDQAIARPLIAGNATTSQAQGSSGRK